MRKDRKFVLSAALITISVMAAGCGRNAPAAISDSAAEETTATTESEAAGSAGTASEAQKVNWAGLQKTGSMDLQYAKEYSVDDYGDYRVISIPEDGQEFLLVPEGDAVPSGLPEGMTVLQQPLDHTYLVSTSVMDYICRIGALDDVVLSGTKEEDWSIEEAQEAMDLGFIQYGGKYNQPDYELILNEGTNFAIENTMIYHNPEVKEKLESLGIPVLVERSSYESDPLGRLEWIRLYGVLYDKEQEADSWFQKEAASLNSVMNEAGTGTTAAYFSVTSNGSVTIRKPGDYVSRLIAMAGGTYVPSSEVDEDDNALSTMNIQMEQFYAQAKDADVLVYNSAIEGEIADIEDLLDKSELFADFKAVQGDQVYCTARSLFQEPTGMGDFVQDLHTIFTGGDTAELTYLTHVGR